MAKELDPQERGVLTRKVNHCAELQVAADNRVTAAKAVKKEIRATMETHGLDRYETDRAVAVLATKEGRKKEDAAVEKIKSIVDAKDFEKICPRGIDLKAFDEVIGHHRYPVLEGVLKKKKSTALTVRQLEG